MKICTRRLAVLLFPVSLLSACASAPVSTPQPLFNDALFAAPPDPISAEAVFALTPAMRRYADAELKPALRQGQKEQAFMDALYSKGQLSLEYDASLTRNASQAFEARTGNCLSLVIMTASFAKYLGLPVRFQQVYTPQTWSRNQRLVVASGHVNLALSPVDNDLNSFTVMKPKFTVDFLPSSQADRFRTRAISETTVIGMYMNNRAAEALAEGRLDSAYAWAAAAIRTAPLFYESYNTLGVIYHQHGNAVEAEAALRAALARTPQNVVAMSNLAGVLRTQQRDAEALRLDAEIARIEPYPPFHFYDLGLAELKAGRNLSAQAFFRRELQRERAMPEANFWLAIACLRSGDTARAERYLKLAVDNSTTLDSRAIYSAKLDWLREQGYQPRDSRRAGG